MVEFAPYEPRCQRRPRAAVDVGLLLDRDVEGCAQLAAAREGMGTERWRDTFTRLLDAGTQRVYVARCGSAVVGYGKVALLSMADARNALPGWYLTGMVVDPAYRRHGVGEALTRARLAALTSSGVREVWYFANAQNRASLRLHGQLGFEEITRDFSIPGVTFAGGVGVLSRWTSPT